MSEATVGVNFVADTQDAIRNVSSLDAAMMKLGETGKALGMAAAAAYGLYKLGSALGGILSQGSTAEMQLVKLETSMASLAMSTGIPAATLALEEYNKAIAFSERTVFEVSDVIDAVQSMRAINIDPLAEQYKNLKGEAVGVLEILGNTSVSASDVQQRIGSLAGAMSGNTHALASLNGQLSLMPGTLQGVVKDLKPGTKAFQDALMGFISKQPQFQDGMYRMSKTLEGIVVGFVDFPKQIMTAMADVTNAAGVYNTVKNILNDLYDYVFENFSKIKFWANVMGQYLAGIVNVIWALIGPIRALFDSIFQYIVGYQERMTGFIKSTGGQVDDVKKLMESIQLYLALVFGSVAIKIEKFWATIKKVLDFLGIDGETVFTMLGIMVGVKLVSAFNAAAKATVNFAKANAKAMMGKVGMFALGLILAKIIQNWDSFSKTTKVAIGIVGGIVAVIWALNIAMKSNPVGLIVAAVGLLIVGIIKLVENWDFVKEKIGQVVDWVVEKLVVFKDWIVNLFSGIGDSIIEALTGAWNSVKDGLGAAYDFIFGEKEMKVKVDGKVSGDRGKLDGRRAGGGPVDAHGAYLVGEKGPELLVMGGKGGNVVPNSGLGGANFNVSINVDARGATDPNAVANALDKQLRKTLPELVRRFGYA